MNLIGRLGLGYLVMSGVLTLCLFIINWLGVPINIESLSTLVAILCILYLQLRKYIPKIDPQKKEEWTRIDIVLIIMIISLVVVVIINGLWNVVSVWDALTLYDFRALRIIETGSIQQAALIQGDYFYGYPLFTSLAHVVLYLMGLKSPMIFYALIFASFISVFYNLIRRSVSHTLSLLASFLLIIAPHLFWHAQIAYTNLPYTIYLGLGAIYILEYSRTSKRSDAILGALLTGLSIWTRSVEPFWMINILVLIGITLFKRKYFDVILSLFIFIPLERIWKVYVAMAHNIIAETTISQASGAVSMVINTPTTSVVSPSVLPTVITYFVANAIRPFMPVLALFITGILYKASKFSRNWLGEFMILGYYSIALLGTYLFSLSLPYWNSIPGSLERMMMFVSPIIIYNFIVTINNYYTKYD